MTTIWQFVLVVAGIMIGLGLAGWWGIRRSRKQFKAGCRYQAGVYLAASLRVASADHARLADLRRAVRDEQLANRTAHLPVGAP